MASGCRGLALRRPSAHPPPIGCWPIRPTAPAPTGRGAPTVTPWLRSSPSPWPPDRASETRPEVPHPPHAHGRRVRTATSPDPPDFELAAHQEAYQCRFFAYACSSCSPGPAHPAVLDRSNFVEAAPHPSRRPPGQAASSFTPPLRRHGDEGLSPPFDTTTLRRAPRCASEPYNVIAHN
jgi:hypothetical protein